MAICPAGHTSAADDYCDVCGLPVGAQTALAPAAVAPVLPLPGALCPHCGTNNAPGSGVTRAGAAAGPELTGRPQMSQ